jgi:hypothetical protein
MVIPQRQAGYQYGVSHAVHLLPPWLIVVLGLAALGLAFWLGLRTGARIGRRILAWLRERAP